MFSYPAFDFNFLNSEEYNFQHVVDLEEFDGIKERICGAVGRPVNLVPGASIGTLGGKVLTTKLDDFIWGTIPFPQISRSACELLCREGIQLFTVPCPMEFRGRRIDTHLALHLEPVSLLAEANLDELGFSHCHACGDFSAPPPIPSTLPYRLEDHVPDGYKIRRDRWPVGEHLVTMRETLRVVASLEFIDATKKHNLTGIQFLECGEYV